MNSFSQKIQRRQKERLPSLRTMDRRSLHVSKKAENQMVEATVPLVVTYQKLVRNSFQRLLKQWKEGRLDAKVITSGDLGAWTASVLSDLAEALPVNKFNTLAGRALRAIDRNLKKNIQINSSVGVSFTSGTTAAYFETERRNALESIEAMFADDVQKLAKALEDIRGLGARGQSSRLVQRLEKSVLTRAQQEEFALVALPRDEAGQLINDLRKIRSEPQKNLLRTVRQRAELLGRDQALSANAGASRIRLQEAGAQRYVWITSQDERVRDNHAELHGTTQEFQDPPIGGGTGPEETGNPGEGINCRCTAYPIFEEHPDEFAGVSLSGEIATKP